MDVHDLKRMEEQTENPNDAKERRNATARSQYYGNYLETSTGRHMSQ